SAWFPGSKVVTVPDKMTLVLPFSAGDCASGWVECKLLPSITSSKIFFFTNCKMISACMTGACTSENPALTASGSTLKRSTMRTESPLGVWADGSCLFSCGVAWSTIRNAATASRMCFRTVHLLEKAECSAVERAQAIDCCNQACSQHLHSCYHFATAESL